MKFIISGATSFLGIALINRLIADGNSVVAICRNKEKADRVLPKSKAIDIVETDMASIANLTNSGITGDVFVNLAWAATGHEGRNMADVQRENIANSIEAMKVSKELGCKLFVEAGSQAEYGSTTETQTEDSPCNPFSEYGKAKLEVKNRCFELSEQLGMKYLHLRIFSLYGKGDKEWTLIMSCIDKMKRNEPIDLSPCTQNWNFLHVSDAATQIGKLCDYAVNDKTFTHEVFHIASKDTRHLRDYVEKMKQTITSSSTLNYGAVKPINLVSLQPSVAKTEQTIGFIANASFEEGIKTMIE